MVQQIKPSTQKFVEIEKIRDGVIYLKNGKLRKILIVSGVNFDLKSEEEQTLILNSFQNFLNGLDFSVQCFIHSRKINIENYLELIKTRQKEESNELLKVQIEEYMEFIKSFVEQNAIITKTFFLIVPYDPIIISSKQTDKIFSFFQKTKPTTSQQINNELTDQKNLQQLNQRMAQVINGLADIGLRAISLDDEAIVELFYNLYNPQLIEKKGILISNEQ